LLVVVLITLASGLTHATDLTDRLGPLTIMQVHVGGGFVALALVIVHYRSHPVRPRTADLERRAFLSAVGLGGVSVATWGAWEAMLGLARAPGAQRRFTGSHERSSYDPSGMPSTVWLDDRTPSIDPVSWHVDIGGRATTLADLAALPQDDVVAVLDCTGGWYSEQTWTGVRLDRLIEVGGHRSIEVHSVTGYSIRFPARDLAKLWLVTAAGGAPLRPGHGAPVRLVAPDRRGFWWVKWVDRVSTSDVPWWLQSPFPLT
jgi:DMSO/TMAO reductase YedYZ molybdopterin-dependent catalytic subunit